MVDGGELKTRGGGRSSPRFCCAGPIFVLIGPGRAHSYVVTGFKLSDIGGPAVITRRALPSGR